eukprot:TRINITY_DN4537_c0_g2_i1.p1 TRINITY_DN4537_c0_g2~~TRINITY_DN4537_c0_g2_i1.p1  ORF type:complete len:260 (+),score=35.61 TRINITY_DN4537_c0_g2_i1:3-782(+)
MDYLDSKPVKRGERISLTFRKVNFNQNCADCEFPAQCDAMKDHVKDSAQKSAIEREHVDHVYDIIAKGFAHTRKKPWPEIEAILNALPFASLVCDVGCGSGRYMPVNCDNLVKVGMDRCVPLLETIDKDQHALICADALVVPFRDNTFDFAMSIAVIHHFSSYEHRKRAILEMTRIVRVGGTILIYVWALEQTNNNRRRFLQQDVFVTWKEQGKVYKRYYHVFKKGELEILCNDIPQIEIVRSFYDRENWCVVLRKLAL